VPTVTIDPQECAGLWPEDSPGPSPGELYLDGIYGAWKHDPKRQDSFVMGNAF
jgi:hypothetical protein